jgi:hypothetical protein
MRRPITLVLAVALLLVASSPPAWARGEADADDLAGVDGDAYESPTWSYTLEWDEDVWSPVLATSEDDVDLLLLQSRRSTLAFQAGPLDADPADCLEGVAGALSSEDGVDDWEPLEDDDGDPVAGERGSRAWAAFTLTFEGDDGDEIEGVYYLECRSLIAGEAALLIVHNTGRDDYEDETEEVDAVLDSLELTAEEPEDDEDDGAAARGSAGTDACDDLAVWVDDTAPRVERAYEIMEEIDVLSMQLEPADFVAVMKGYAAEFADMGAAQWASDPPAAVVDANRELATTFDYYAEVVTEIADMLEYSQIALIEGFSIDNSVLSDAWALLPQLTTYLGEIVAYLSPYLEECGIDA